MLPATQKIPLQNDKFAQVCGNNCGSYFTVEEPMPLEVDFRKADSKPLKILTLTSNVMAFGLADSKGKFIVHVTRSNHPGMLTILCCIRYACQQKVVKFNVTKDDFQLITDSTSMCIEGVQFSKVLAVLVNFKEKIISQDT